MKQNYVATNLQQDFTHDEKLQARRNIDCASDLGFVDVYRPFSDSSISENWAKIAELTPAQSSNFSFDYQLSLKMILTNNGNTGDPAESATFNLGTYITLASNVARDEGSWSDHTYPIRETSAIEGIKILRKRATNYGPMLKEEIWIKLSSAFTYYSKCMIRALVNEGSFQERTSSAQAMMIDTPWALPMNTVAPQHVDPEEDENHQDGEDYAWTSVYFGSDPKVVMSDHIQTFTTEEKTQARDNIDAAKKIPWVYYNSGNPTPDVQYSDLSVVESEQGARIQNYDGSKKYFVAPDPVDANGKFLGVDQNTGSVGWRSAPTPEPGTFMKLYNRNMNGNSSNTKILDYSVDLPARNGQYPTKVIGNIDVIIDGTDADPGFSVCMTSGYHSSGETGVSWDPIDPGSNCNFDHLLGGGMYNNNIEFMFDTSNIPNVKKTGVRYLTLKGQSNSTYNIKKLQCMCFYEDTSSIPENNAQRTAPDDYQNNDPVEPKPPVTDPDQLEEEEQR